MAHLSLIYTKKITLFNTFFADQCTPINNSSTLPPFEYQINSNIENISFSEHEIVSIIRSLNSKQSTWMGWDFHSHDKNV